MEAAKELAKTELFEGLPPEDLAAFASVAREVRFAPDMKVYDPGASGDALYVIVEGAFSVQVKDDHGDEVEVARLKAGNYFGEMEVIGGIGRTAAVVSMQDGRCYVFDAAALMALLKDKSHLAAHFYQRVARELVRRLKNTTRDMGFFKARAT